MIVRECARLCAGVRGYARVCGMNFQNFFRRIESLHQRTLIRFLYEFFTSLNIFLKYFWDLLVSSNLCQTTLYDNLNLLLFFSSELEA